MAAILGAGLFGDAHAQAPSDLRETGAGARHGAPFVLDFDTIARELRGQASDIATEIMLPSFETRPLDAPGLEATGLIPARVAGVAADLWGTSEVGALAALFRDQPVQGLGTMAALTQTLALAELDPPQGARGDRPALLSARIDMLIARGALDPAESLLERAGADDPLLFSRAADLAFLSGRSDGICARMNAEPVLAPGPAARVFCLARLGRWGDAVLIWGISDSLGVLTEGESDLLARFLDPALAEDAPPLPPAGPDLSPLEFQLRMALAERPDTSALPLAFAHADLSELAGWRAQLLAAERLVRAGAIAPAQWVAIATARRPAASGALWDRAGAVAAMDHALGLAPEARGAALAETLPQAWALMEEAGLGFGFAQAFGPRLLTSLQSLENRENADPEGPLSAELRGLIQRIVLVSPAYDQIGAVSGTVSAEIAVAVAIAETRPPDPGAGASSTTRAITAAFTGAETPPPEAYAGLLATDRRGEAVLRAATVLDTARDPGDLSDALRLLRHLGLEDAARRAALELLLLGPATP